MVIIILWGKIKITTNDKISYFGLFAIGNWPIITFNFYSSIANIGNADFRPFIPKSHWQWHACHMHYHSMEVCIKMGRGRWQGCPKTQKRPKFPIWFNMNCPRSGSCTIDDFGKVMKSLVVYDPLRGFVWKIFLTIFNNWILPRLLFVTSNKISAQRRYSKGFLTFENMFLLLL